MLPSKLRLRAPAPLDATVRPPGSKSLTNRALLAAGLAKGESHLRGCLASEDSEHMVHALRSLGVQVDVLDEGATELRVHGLGPAMGRNYDGRSLWCGTAGTATRFLAAALAGVDAPGPFVLDGSERMRERPMAGLLRALEAVGAKVTCPRAADVLPLHITPTRLRGGAISMPRPRSSQFVSAMLYAGLLGDAPLELSLPQGTPARPYVDMTLSVLSAFGAEASWSGEELLRVEPGRLHGQDYEVPVDASAASYPLALAAIWGGRVRVEGMGANAEQGDAGFWRVLERFGARGGQDATSTWIEGGHALRGCELDLTDMPDMTLTAAVVAAFAEGKTAIRGVEILRHHESDRLAAGASELRKLGARVDELEDGLHIEPPAHLRRDACIDTYDDHRMAMAFSLAGNVVIAEPACCAKTWPDYFEVLDGLGMVEGPA